MNKNKIGQRIVTENVETTVRYCQVWRVPFMMISTQEAHTTEFNVYKDVVVQKPRTIHALSTWEIHCSQSLAVSLKVIPELC